MSFFKECWANFPFNANKNKYSKFLSVQSEGSYDYWRKTPNKHSQSIMIKTTPNTITHNALILAKGTYLDVKRFSATRANTPLLV